MVSMAWAKRIAGSKRFDQLTAVLIVVNAGLMGVQLNHNAPWIEVVQDSILAFFVIELLIRFWGRVSNAAYFGDGWNYFDIFVVSVSFIPETILQGADVSVLRTFRVFRIFRLLKKVEELSLITGVLLRSIRSLGYSGILFFIFLYVYAVVGVSIFQHPDYSNSVNAGLNPSNPDPYGTLGEAMFSLFRIMTGEDWTDLRYNLLSLNPSDEWSFLVTTYHVSWMIVSAFLLLNLVVGAVISNFEKTIAESKEAAAKRNED